MEEKREDLIEQLGDLMYSRILTDVFGEKVSERFSEREKGPSALDRARGAYMDFNQRQQVLNGIRNQQQTQAQPQQQSGYQPIP